MTRKQVEKAKKILHGMEIISSASIHSCRRTTTPAPAPEKAEVSISPVVFQALEAVHRRQLYEQNMKAIWEV